MSRQLLGWAAVALGALIQISAHAQIPQSERDALTAFYSSTGGDHWLKATAWNSAAGTECTWLGVSCDSAQTHVVSLVMESNNLTGTLPASLEALAALQTLDVSGNQLTGPLPRLTAFPDLTAFAAIQDQFSGEIPSLQGLSNLKVFQVPFNQLTGSLPSLAGLTKLEVFVVSFNQLSGSIPALDGLTNLKVIYLGENQFTGQLPKLSGVGLDNLVDFEAWKLQLTGSLPTLAGLTNLKTFFAYHNKLTGSLPSREDLAHLTRFSASFNELTGPVPAIDHLPALQMFEIGDNQFSGGIASLAGLPALTEIAFQNAGLSGALPDPSDSTNLQVFWFYGNRFTGSLPTLTKFKHLQLLVGWGNQLTGTIPSLDGLVELAAVDISSNLFTGPIPSLSGLKALYYFNVLGNALSGNIPSLSGLSKLSTFVASYNRMIGPIPSLAGLTALQFFDVGSNGLSGALPALAGLNNLQEFTANSNAFTGPVPSLTGLQNLQLFDVSNNSLSGSMPSLAGLKLKQFNISNNRMSGAIAAVPQPSFLVPSLSGLCPNLLAPSVDKNWDAATGQSPWYSKCATSGLTDFARNATKDMTNVDLSADGQIRVFQSLQTDLTTNTANAGGEDVYSVSATGGPVLESIDSTGKKLVGTSRFPAISPDGKIVAFQYLPVSAQAAKDLSFGQVFAGPLGGPKHPVDAAVGGVPPNGGASGAPSLSSAAGTYELAFCSAASNLVTNDTNGLRDIFLVDPTNAALAAQRVSVDSEGKELPGDSCEPKLSGDGSKLVFSLSSSALYGTAARQIVVKDLATAKSLNLTGQMLPITVNTSGHGADADSSEPVINDDGSVIAFTSQADLDGNGAPAGGKEVFISIAKTGSRLLRRARAGDGTVPDGTTQHPRISADGTTVVLQTDARNFLTSKSLGKAALSGSTPQCGSIAITTNFLSVNALGGSLCTSDGKTSNQTPAISADGTTGGFDSNTPKDNGNTTRSTYLEGLGVFVGTHVANLSGDYSGQWYDPSQSGQGLVIDVLNPDANDNRVVLLTWFVFANSEPTWVQGAGVAKAGSGPAANTVIVQMDDVAIFQGSGFPLGGASATPHRWGSITLTFADANTGKMSWRSEYPGFEDGSMPLNHFLNVALPKNDAPGAAISACISGNWFNPAQAGHGFEFEVLATNPPLLIADWFAFAPNGSPVWLYGAAPLNGNSVQMQLILIDGYGAQFPPKFNPALIVQNLWGTATFTFADAAHANVAWNSIIPGYGSGSQPLQPLSKGLLDRRGCN